jgi:hypothetical protein
MNMAMERGPMTLLLVFRNDCPHCVTFKPIWEDLCKTRGRKANMISMESSVYSETEMSQKKPVSAVPTVLRVGPGGEIEEVTDPRQKVNMTNLIKMTPVSATPNVMAPPMEPNRVMAQKKPTPKESVPVAAPSQMLQQALSVSKEINPIVPLRPATQPTEVTKEVKPTEVMEPSVLSAASDLFKPTQTPAKTEARPVTQIPGTRIEVNPLEPIPATPVASSQRIESVPGTEAMKPLAVPGTEAMKPLLPTAVAESMKPLAVPGTEAMKPLLPASATVQQGLPPIGQVLTQKGGGPWSAFLQVASQAAPAAALLGAYAMLPTKRSSGLPAARRTRRKAKAKAN